MRSGLPRLLVLACTLLAAPAPGHGQDKTEDGAPEAVAHRALVALQENRVDDFAAAMHPEALKGFHKIFVDLLSVAKDDEEAGELLPLFEGVDSVDALRALDDRAFFVSFYKGLSRLRPEINDILAKSELKTLGHVMEGDDTAHVVYRMSIQFEGISITKMQVLSLRRTPEGWAMLLSGDIEGIANAFRQRFAKPRPE